MLIDGSIASQLVASFIPEEVNKKWEEEEDEQGLNWGCDTRQQLLVIQSMKMFRGFWEIALQGVMVN